MRLTIRNPGPLRATAAAALAFSCLLPCMADARPAPVAPRIQLSDGVIEGARVPAFGHSLRLPAVDVFRGIPYAAPPVGELRWRDPEPVARWAGVRPAQRFGPRCMQLDSPTEFQSNEMSEDCLYLNVWTPSARKDEKLPVLVYFHGGGFLSGDGSEPRYDGASLAERGIIVVTVNYRLGAFGFFALPDAAGGSSPGNAGNYGLLDQVAALRWVRDNIAQFGGDPAQVTIAGNSAGAISVSAHMASPLSRGLFARAIGESGAAFAPLAFWTREEAERSATQFAAMLGSTSLQELRALPGGNVLAATQTTSAAAQFRPHVDGQFLTESPEAVYSAGRQAPVPLMLGSNSQEGHFSSLLGDAAPTPENWRSAIKRMFPALAEEVLAYYPGNNKDEVMHAGNALASDLFVGHATWRWMQLHQQSGRAPVYYYHYTHPRPPSVDAGEASEPQPVLGAAHGAEIEYALGNLSKERRYQWTAVDYDVSRVFASYVERFVKTGDPDGARPPIGSGVVVDSGDMRPIPKWPAVRADNRGIVRQVISEDTHTSWDREGPRQGLIESLLKREDGNDPTAFGARSTPRKPEASTKR